MRRGDCKKFILAHTMMEVDSEEQVNHLIATVSVNGQYPGAPYSPGSADYDVRMALLGDC